MADIVVAVRCRYWRRLKQLHSAFASDVEVCRHLRGHAHGAQPGYHVVFGYGEVAFFVSVAEGIALAEHAPYGGGGAGFGRKCSV